MHFFDQTVQDVARQQRLGHHKRLLERGKQPRGDAGVAGSGGDRDCSAEMDGALRRRECQCGDKRAQSGWRVTGIKDVWLGLWAPGHCAGCVGLSHNSRLHMHENVEDGIWRMEDGGGRWADAVVRWC